MLLSHLIFSDDPSSACLRVAPLHCSDRKGEIPTGKLPYFNYPVFHYYKACAMLRQVPRTPAWGQFVRVSAADHIPTIELCH
jgi:hypothetical protein